MDTRVKLSTVLVLVCTLVLGLVAGAVQTKAQQEQLTFWTLEVEKQRMTIQKDIARDFEKVTGIPVKVVPVQESKMGQKVTAAKAAGTLPDVIFHPGDFSAGWAEVNILDQQAATEVINKLGKDTFGGLRLVNLGEGEYAAIPSDGWSNLIIYRKDLFQKYDLNPPKTWEDILKAAKKLHDPPNRFGFVAATHPTIAYTQQVFEQVAMSNGVRLVDEEGNVNLDTPEMVEALKFYKKLADYTPPGNIYWKQTRLFYVTGKAAMIFWSPFILDDIAGAREDIEVAVPNLPQKTGVISSLSGPNGKAAYIGPRYFGITTNANVEEAQKFVQFMLTADYQEFFSMDPFGKMPFRQGTKLQPTRFIDDWKLSSPYFADYSDQVIQNLFGGLKAGDRWGLAKKKGELVSKIYGTNILSKILTKDYLRGDLTAEETAERMQQAVEDIE